MTIGTPCYEWRGMDQPTSRQDVWQALATLTSLVDRAGAWAAKYGSPVVNMVHDDRELASHRKRITLEAEPLSQLNSPFTQIALGSAAGEQHRCSFVEQPAQVAVTPSGNVPVIVDLARLDDGAQCSTIVPLRFASDVGPRQEPMC